MHGRTFGITIFRVLELTLSDRLQLSLDVGRDHAIFGLFYEFILRHENTLQHLDLHYNGRYNGMALDHLEPFCKRSLPPLKDRDRCSMCS